MSSHIEAAIQEIDRAVEHMERPEAIGPDRLRIFDVRLADTRAALGATMAAVNNLTAAVQVLERKARTL